MCQSYYIRNHYSNVERQKAKSPLEIVQYHSSKGSTLNTTLVPGSVLSVSRVFADTVLAEGAA